jgi:hypothetical protein
LSALARRIEELEGALREVGAPERIPAPLRLEFAGKEYIRGGARPDADAGAEGNTEARDEGGDGMDEEHEEETAVEAILQGAGSLSIREQDGRTRFLGVSAGSAYYFKVSI